MATIAEQIQEIYIGLLGRAADKGAWTIGNEKSISAD